MSADILMMLGLIEAEPRMHRHEDIALIAKQAAAEIVRLRGEVPYDRELIAKMLDEHANEECPTHTAGAIREQAQLLRKADNADAAGVHSATIAPAEAKGGAHDCMRSYSCPACARCYECNRKTGITPQPADGGASHG